MLTILSYSFFFFFSLSPIVNQLFTHLKITCYDLLLIHDSSVPLTGFGVGACQNGELQTSIGSSKEVSKFCEAKFLLQKLG